MNDERHASTRRGFLAAALTAAPAAALAGVLPAAAAPPPPTKCDAETLRGMQEISDRDGWRVAGPRPHPWCRDFLLGIWAASDACWEAGRLAPECQCSACNDMNAFGVVLEFFSAAVEAEYCHGPGFPEFAERHDIPAEPGRGNES